MAGEDGFLTRWSRRKLAEKPDGAEPEPASLPVEEPAPPEPLVSEEPEFDVSSLPDIESLTAESDVSAFLRKGVPEFLKNAALRKAWSADPAIRDYIGPVENGWNFNDPNAIPGFAEYSPGLDAEAMVREIMGEPGLPEPVDPTEFGREPVLESVRRPGPPRASIKLDSAPDPAESCDKSLDAVQHQTAGIVEEKPEAPPRRRHGGAVPH